MSISRRSWGPKPDGDDSPGALIERDAAFDIDQGWTLVTAIVVGYLLSRGFAKAGSREEYTRDS
jgi:hypothetical protein